MIDLSVLPLFFTAIFFLVISPGPDMVLITAYSSTRGFRFGLMVSLGIFLAGVVQTLLVAFGLGQLMQTLPSFAYAIKIAGAMYLAWLGYKRLRVWFENKTEALAVPEETSLSKKELISKGLFSNLLNPKALLSFSLFLPQFTSGTGALTAQILILGLLLSSFAFMINCCFSFFFSNVGRLVAGKLRSGRKLARHVDGLLGLLFVGLATRLAISR